MGIDDVNDIIEESETFQNLKDNLNSEELKRSMEDVFGNAFGKDNLYDYLSTSNAVGQLVYEKTAKHGKFLMWHKDKNYFSELEVYPQENKASVVVDFDGEKLVKGEVKGVEGGDPEVENALEALDTATDYVQDSSKSDAEVHQMIQRAQNLLKGREVSNNG